MVVVVYSSVAVVAGGGSDGDMVVGWGASDAGSGCGGV